VPTASVIVLPTARALTVRRAVDDYCDQLRNPRTRKAYAIALERVVDVVGGHRLLTDVDGAELAQVLEQAWGSAAANTWNARRAAIASWLSWCQRRGDAIPSLPADVRAERVPVLVSRARSRTAIDRVISRRDVGVREKALWRMLYETAARAEEVLPLNVEDLNLAGRTALVRGKSAGARRRGAVDRDDFVLEPIFWDAGTARLLSRLIGDRRSGPVFLTDRRPSPGRARAERDVDPLTGRGRLSYSRAAKMFGEATAGERGGPWGLHDLRHSALTHLGEAGASLPLLMAKSRHRKLETLRIYVRPGAAAMSDLTSLLGPR